MLPGTPEAAILERTVATRLQRPSAVVPPISIPDTYPGQPARSGPQDALRTASGTRFAVAMPLRAGSPHAAAALLLALLLLGPVRGAHASAAVAAQVQALLAQAQALTAQAQALVEDSDSSWVATRT